VGLSWSITLIYGDTSSGTQIQSNVAYNMADLGISVLYNFYLKDPFDTYSQDVVDSSSLLDYTASISVSQVSVKVA